MIKLGGYRYSHRWLRKVFASETFDFSKTSFCIRNLYRCYTGSTFHVPSAYRFRRDTFGRESPKNDKSAYFKEMPDELRSINRLENEAKNILKLYEASLNPDLLRNSIVDHNAAASSENISSDHKIVEKITREQLVALAECLQNSEDKYRHLCVKFRQIIAGWSSLRPTSTTELNKFQKHFTPLFTFFKNRITDIMDRETFKLSNNEEPLDILNDHSSIKPPKRAEDYLLLLDDLRRHRSWMIQMALSECYNYQTGRSLETHSTQNSIGNGIVKWMKSLFQSIHKLPTDELTISDSSSTNTTPSQLVTSHEDLLTEILTTLQGLKAHELSNFTPNIRLYKEVMKSYIHWHNLLLDDMSSTDCAEKDKATQNTQEEDIDITESNPASDNPSINASQYQLIADELDRLLQVVKHNFHVRKNLNLLPDREMYHILMKNHATLGSFSGALRVIHLLQEMKESACTRNTLPISTDAVNHIDPSSTRKPHHRHGRSQSQQVPDDVYKPTLQSYCIALRACRNFMSYSHLDNLNDKLLIVDHAMEIFQESESFNSSKTWTDGEDVVGTEADSYMTTNKRFSGFEPCDPIWSPRFLTFSIMNLAGHKVVPDLCNRVDSIMIQLIGETPFLALVGENESYPHDYTKIELGTCHLLIEIYNRKKEKRYADRAKAILRYMEEAVKHHKVSCPYPSQLTYNSVIKSLLLERTVESAETATLLLDSMVRRPSSMPTRFTFNGILQLWSCSDSQRAGENASAILTRMELHNMLISDISLRPSARTYELALKCWGVAAFKGYPSAAKRAYEILKSMEAQCCSILLKEPVVESRLRSTLSRLYSNQLRPEPSLYSHVVHACSKTTNESDKAEALQIAFEVYNRSIDRKLPPTKMMYFHLLHCCNLIPETRKYQRQNALRTIVNSMSDEYQSDKDIALLIQTYGRG